MFLRRTSAARSGPDCRYKTTHRAAGRPETLVPQGLFAVANRRQNSAAAARSARCRTVDADTVRRLWRHRLPLVDRLDHGVTTAGRSLEARAVENGDVAQEERGIALRLLY